MWLILAVIIVCILIIFTSKRSTPEHLTSAGEPPRWPEKSLYFPLPQTMGELTAIEQVRTLDNMLSGSDDSDGSDDPDKDIARENEYIKSLPRSSDCEDKYEACPIWASRGECIINPEYMLYNCASSCEACALNDQEKYNVTYIYNSRPPAGCVYHGEDYPSVRRYMHELYML